MPAHADAPAVRHLRIAVAGNPNSGKTTLFNRLTGLRQKVANYPGVTVERREATLLDGSQTLIDLPGIYSLAARSPDEQIARQAILGQLGEPAPDAMLIVVDASNLERNLYLATQLIELGLPVVIACNMMDVAKRGGLRVDCRLLARALGVPVIATAASTGQGIDDLRAALRELGTQSIVCRRMRLPIPYESSIEHVAEVFINKKQASPQSADGQALLWLSDYLSGEPAAREWAERTLAKLDPASAESLRQAADMLGRIVADAAALAIETRYTWIGDVLRGVIRRGDSAVHHGTITAVELSVSAKSSERIALTRPSDRVDRILLHPLYGYVIFASLMFVMFLAIFSWAQPLMQGIETLQRAAADAVRSHMADGPLRSLLADGVILGVGSVVSFFPQICILFLFIGLLEDSGYMARAAFLMDRLMGRVGLHGKSFIPLLSSYACAIPGILATRTIENRRDRFTTIMIAPLMSCSARLPVYLIVIGAVFGDRLWLKASVMFGLYALGTLTALLMAWLFKKTLLRGPRPAFIMELPPYHRPRPGVLLRNVWDRSKSFLTNAGTIIFAVCVILWALSYYPRLPEAKSDPQQSGFVIGNSSLAISPEADLASRRLRHSYIGRLGHAIEPVIRPLGFDWRLGIGILSSFLAREVFVGSMGVTFSLGEADEHSQALRERLAGATWPDGRKLLTPLAGISLLVFYVLACQCISTLAVVRKETQSWAWPALMFFYMTTMAYVASLVIYQGGQHLGIH